MTLCPACTDATMRWLDAITPGPHRPMSWEPQPIGRYRVADGDNRHARTSIGTQLLRTARAQIQGIAEACRREHGREVA